MTNLKLTKEEEAIILGTLLGDGHIQKRNTSYRLKIQHCLKQKDYIFWKYEKLKRLCFESTYPKKIKTKIDSTQYYFFLKSGLYLKQYHELFYQEYEWKPLNKDKSEKNDKIKIRYKKTITSQLIDFFPNNPLILAVWFMDDGHRRKEHFSGKLATNAFSKDEQHLLQDYILSSFNIKTNVVLASRLKNQYYLSIPGKNKNFENFVDLIESTVNEIPSMEYKIERTNNF